jgi:hypothetical protein
MKHFEELWEEAEALTKEKPSEDLDNVIETLHSLLDNYKTLNAMRDGGEIVGFLKQKKLGEIIFRLTELSQIDGINSYASLLLEINYNSKKY